MKRTVEVEFSEEAPVEIPALTVCAEEVGGNRIARRHFWLGWQLFGKD